MDRSKGFRGRKQVKIQSMAQGVREQKKSPSEGRSLWLWGWHGVKMALANPSRVILKVLITKKNYQIFIQEAPELLKSLKNILEIVETRDIAMALENKTAVHQGIALQTLPLEPLALEDLVVEPHHRLLVLDQITDPHNVGALWRSSAVFKIQGIVMGTMHAPNLDGVIAKAACGALEIVPQIQVVNLAQAMEKLKKMGFWCVGLSEKGQTPLSAIPKDRPLAIVMGSEGSGLRSLTEKKCDFLAYIEGNPVFGTLNASTAGAIALYCLSS
jgi:23S rRNA (guanosine2251-2'-O)-methyltransferase